MIQTFKQEDGLEVEKIVEDEPKNMNEIESKPSESENVIVEENNNEVKENQIITITENKSVDHEKKESNNISEDESQEEVES